LLRLRTNLLSSPRQFDASSSSLYCSAVSYFQRHDQPGRLNEIMRLLNYLVHHNLQVGAPPQHAAQGLAGRQLVPAVPAVNVPVQVGTLLSASLAACSTKVTVTVQAGILPTLLGKRQVAGLSLLPLSCTTTVTVSRSTVTSINSVTSRYTGPSSASSTSPPVSSATPVRHYSISLSLCSKLCSVNLWGNNVLYRVPHHGGQSPSARCA
jgi:hypothetical protein